MLNIQWGKLFWFPSIFNQVGWALFSLNAALYWSTCGVSVCIHTMYVYVKWMSVVKVASDSIMYRVKYEYLTLTSRIHCVKASMYLFLTYFSLHASNIPCIPSWLGYLVFAEYSLSVFAFASITLSSLAQIISSPSHSPLLYFPNSMPSLNSTSL